MKNLIIFCLFVIFLVAVQFASGQTVDEILDKYVKARGGKEKLLGIKSVYMEGMTQMMGNDVTVKITKEQGKLSRREFEMGGTNGYMLITDKEAWSYMPMRSPTPNKLPDEAVAGMQTELDIAGPLVDYVSKGHKAELIGKDSVDAVSCYKIKLSSKAGKEIIYWIDGTKFLLVKSSVKNVSRKTGAEAEQITFYKDYKAVDGVLFPHTIETKSTGGDGRGNGSATFDKIEINQPVDPKLYQHN